MVTIQDRVSGDFSDSDYEEVDIENSENDSSKRSQHFVRLNSGRFPDVIPTTEKKSNPTKQCTLCSRKRDLIGKPDREDSRFQRTEFQLSNSALKIRMVLGGMVEFSIVLSIASKVRYVWTRSEDLTDQYIWKVSSIFEIR
ncbi:hypothetical protein TNCV_2760981 [Trichonephila clavipes]|nr:hypothetical protein TNCV_2760981 [Trichonephila clavipes]